MGQAKNRGIYDDRKALAKATLGELKESLVRGAMIGIFRRRLSITKAAGPETGELDSYIEQYPDMVPSIRKEAEELFS